MTLTHENVNEGDPEAPLPANRTWKFARWRWHFWGLGGTPITFGLVALTVDALTNPSLRTGDRVFIIAYACYAPIAFLILFGAVLRLVQDRNFWRKKALHDFDQLKTHVDRAIDEGEEWKRG